MVVYGPDMGVGHGIIFDPNRPEDILEQIVWAASPGAAGSAVVVTGAGGGAGVTTVALHLAAVAASGSTAVCYADVDLSWGAHARLGLAEDTRTWGDVDDGPGSLQLAAVPVPGGFRAMMSPRGAGSADPSRPDPARIVKRAVGEFEHVVVDAPHPSLTSDLLSLGRVGVLVVSPTVPSAGRARQLLDRWPECRWAIVSNRAGPGGESTRSGLERILNRKLALELPCTPALRDAEDDGRLLAQRWSRWGRGIARLWRALEDA